MAKKWVVPLLFALPFIPVLFWGIYLPDPAYAPLGALQRAAGWPALFVDSESSLQALSTPLFPIGVGLLTRLGFEPATAAVLLSTPGWAAAAALMWWLGRKIKYNHGSLAAAVLFCFNPWIVTTLGQATGWIIAIIWLIANFLLRKRYLASAIGTLFLISLFFRPSQGFAWPSGLAAPLAWSLLLFAAAVGLERLAVYLTDNDLIGLDQKRATVLFLGLLSLVILTWQGSRLWQELNARPLAHWSVEEETASWLRANTEVDATLLSSERLAYLANRENVAASPEQLQSLLFEDPPDYVVAGSALPWQLLREAIWFRLFYEKQATFGDAAAAQSQQEIWAYRPPAEWLGEVALLNARIPDQMSVLGYQMDPQPAASGQPLNLALHLQTPQASLNNPQPFQAILRLVSPLDGGVAGEWTVELPRSLPVGSWQPRQVIVEPIQIRLPQDLQSAAYGLTLSISGTEDGELWPISFNNDVNRLDRIPLGYVTVPWAGSMDSATPLAAAFAEGIQLAGVETGEAFAGEALETTLYWQTSEPVEKAYSVFVHLMDSQGQLVANHDGPPAASRFPSDAWLPDMTIPDTHNLPLPGDLAPGNYELRAGLYDPATGQRLPLHFIDGQPVEGDSVSLGVVALE